MVLRIGKYLCARCLGIVIGGVLAFSLNMFRYNLSPLWAAILIIPMIIDGSLQALNYRDSNNLSRIVTGVLFGFGLYYLAFDIGFKTKVLSLSLFQQL